MAGWVEGLFLGEAAPLFLRVMESERSLERGERLAEEIDSFLGEEGLSGGRVLEVGCGSGRVAVPLARRGYRVVGIDVFPLFVERARERARSEGVDAEFLVVDARRMGEALRGRAPFDAILFAWTSVIGYFDEETDLSILRQARSLARPGSILLVVDTANRDRAVLNSLLLRRITFLSEYGDLVVAESPEFDPETSRMRSRWTFYERRGRDLIFLGEAGYDVRVYSLHELISLAGEAGWSFVGAYESLGDRKKFSPIGPINAAFRAV